MDELARGLGTPTGARRPIEEALQVISAQRDDDDGLEMDVDGAPTGRLIEVYEHFFRQRLDELGPAQLN